MRKSITIMVILFFIGQGFAGASTITTFTDGNTELVAWPKNPSFVDYVNLSLPADCLVKKATMNISSVPPDEYGSDCPQNLKITLNGTTLFSFNGTNNGGFGKQIYFNGNMPKIKLTTTPGQKSNASIYLPKNANITNATTDIILLAGNGSTVELMNYTTMNDNGGPVVARAGDFNGDGYEDFMLASNRYSENSQDLDYCKGKVDLFYGNDEGF